MSPKAVVRLARRIGLDAIAVTDHYDYARSLRGTVAAKRLAEERGLTAYLGTEYSVTNGPTRGHVLLYFDDVDQVPARGLTLDELVDHARSEGLPLVHPHPYGFAGIEDVAFMRAADHIELNGSYRNGPVNRRLMEVAADLGLAHKLVANSDAHARGQMGSAHTVVEELFSSVADTLATTAEAVIATPRRTWGKAAKAVRAVFAPVGLAVNGVQMLATGRALRQLPTPGEPTPASA